MVGYKHFKKNVWNQHEYNDVIKNNLAILNYFSTTFYTF